MLEKLKKAFAGTFAKDLSRFEPGQEGLVIGEHVRIRAGADSVTVCFLRGTPPAQRKLHLDRLKAAAIAYEQGDDYVL
jgi:hypothetical protein